MTMAIQETALGQQFVADASLLVDARQAGDSDRLEHTVNYAEVYRWAGRGASERHAISQRAACCGTAGRNTMMTGSQAV